MKRQFFAFLILIVLCGTTALADVLIPTHSANWKYFVGTQEASSPIQAWRTNTFADDSWITAPAPIGYANPANDPGGFEATIATVLPNTNPNTWLCVYFRKAFTIPDPASISRLDLTITSDDGFVAYINGVEVGRFNVAGAPGQDLLFNQNLDNAGEPSTQTFSITANLGSILVPGVNILGIQNFNANLTSSDFFMDAELDSQIDNIAPIVANQIPPAGATVTHLTEIEVDFSEPVQGVDATDLLINNVAATSLSAGAPGQYVFQFSQPPTGAVQITWAAGHGITDLAAAHNPFSAVGWSYTLDPNSAPASFVINEFMAVNDNSIHDEDGDNSDWIEIFNPSATVGSLNGWFLTDDPFTLTKWRFPNVSVGPSSYLIVFASNKNRTNAAGRLHTNFQLASGGEYLALVDPQTNVVSSFAPTNQFSDVSFGRDRSIPGVVGYFAIPTPGAANSVSGAGFAPEVLYSRSAGTFPLAAPFGLALSNTLPGAIVYYAFGTNVPGTNTFRYTNGFPISITNTTLIRARAFATNVFPGPISSRSYIALDNTVLGFKSDLPIMILHNYGQGIVPASKAEQYVLVQTFDTDFGQSSMTNHPNLSERGTFHVRGSSTAVASSGKSAFFLEVQDEFRDGKAVPMLGLPDESDWVLYAPNNFEPALIHNPLAFAWYRDIGRYASRTRFFEVYLKDDSGTPAAIVSSDYQGIYVLQEKIKRDKNRVDIAPLDREDTNAPAVTGGYIWSIDRATPGEPQVGGGGATLNWISPTGLEMTNAIRAPQRTYVQNLLTSFGNALASTDYTNPITGYAAYIDVDSWIDLHIHEVITFNVDGLRLSGYLYKDRNAKISYGPPWDYDRTQGSTDGRDANPRTWRSTSGDLGTDFFNPQSSGVPWWGRLFTAQDFWQAWIDRYQALRDDVLTTNNINAHIDSLGAEVATAQPREQARWGIQPRGANGTGAGTFATELQWKKNWYAARLDFADTNFLARPTLSSLGGQVSSGFPVTITPAAKPGSSLFFTLDGTDPRLPGGAISPTAFSNNGPVTVVVTNNVRIFARSWNPTHKNLTGANNPPTNSIWSGTAVDTFYISIPSLRITEIMYNPPPPPAGNTNDTDNFEYIELKNTGATAINLDRFRLRGGIEFDFTNRVLAPHSNIVVVANVAAFQARYGLNIPIAGVYTKNLGNSGDHLILQGGVREPILDFEFKDSWYPVTDGAGFSLQIVNENAPLNTWGLKESWRPSGIVNGTPGLDDPGAPVLPVIYVNEALTHIDPPASDAIELYNPNGTNVDIGGWFLTDSFNSPTKYRIAAGTIVPANGYLALYETNTYGGAFGLSSKGDQVYLFSGNASSNLTGYAHGFDFGAQATNVTFGRHVISTGDDHFVAQTSRTLGAANAGPLVGPIVISEINYHPPDLIVLNVPKNDSRDEYIELQNIGVDPVPLFDTNHPANTWQLRDAVDFTFPQGATIPAGGTILVVSIDPSDPIAADGFRSRNGVAPAVPLYGPFNGDLDNAQDSVELVRPDAPESAGAPDAGFVPYILVERVKYSDTSPWPVAADGIGPSLQRINGAGYGDDPVNWTAASPTPGAPYPGGVVPSITTQPTNQTVVQLTTVNMVVAATGSAPLRYQWRVGGHNIPNATNASLSLPSVQASQAGQYDVVVLNPAGSVVSTPANLVVLVPPAVITQPVSRSVHPGVNVSFNVVASGTAPIAYQWRLNNSNISGATNSFYSLVNVQPGADGGYSVFLTNAAGSAQSLPASLVVYTNPVITANLTNINVKSGTNVSFVIVANSGTPISYQWYRNGTNIVGATNSTYNLTNVQPANEGAFSVLLGNAFGTSISSTSQLSILVVPVIFVHPQGATVLQGSTVTFSAAAFGSPQPLSFRWRKNPGGLTLTNIIINGTNSSITITNVQPYTNGTYTVVVTNLAGASALSSNAVLTVLADNDGDGIADDWERLYGFSTNSVADASADPDQDGMTNLQEYLAGTDPTNALSYLKIDSSVLNGAGPNTLLLTVSAVSNHTYTIICRDDVATGTWLRLADIDAQSVNRVVTITNQLPGAVTNRFYRLQTPRLP
jgi:hypothetical protein